MIVSRPFVLFLALLLPAVAILVAGTGLAWRTGQADPWLWAWPAVLLLTPLGLLLSRQGWRVGLWAAGAAAGMALIFCAIAAGRAPDSGAMTGLVLVALLAVGGGLSLRTAGRRVRAGGLLLLGAAALLLWRGPPRPILSQPDRPALAVLSALPLFWREGATVPDALGDAPITALLRSRFDLRPLDDPRDLAASGARRLLLAQPRGMTPAGLVLLDRWLRDGGTALVLADPMLRWPSALPLGDRRRPPSISPLEPLLRHWGVAMLPAEAQEIRHFLPDGRLLTLSGAAPLRVAGHDALVQRLRIGRGQVVMVGDADMLDDRLWLSDPARPKDPQAWSADTPQLVAQWLGGDLPGDRRWLRSLADVRIALRSALLVGLGWAILGLVLLTRKYSGKRIGTDRENLVAEIRKNG